MYAIFLSSCASPLTPTWRHNLRSRHHLYVSWIQIVSIPLASYLSICCLRLDYFVNSSHVKMPKISESVKRDLELLTEAYHHLWTVVPEERNANDFVWPLKRYLVAEDVLVTPALEHHLGRRGEKRHQRLSDDDQSVCIPFQTPRNGSVTDF